ncbi:MAG: RIP metalloprotease RseP [Treponema sp.]|jgi:regulator of sigma E protease|nr:RIP metalloprotease RseP [Treponema sp.]
MLLIKIILGLFGLGIVVFIHELGHFLAARLVGIDVEAFSIGWGNPILKKKIGTVEYRLGMFPIGGYCKMKGYSDFAETREKTHEDIKAESGSFLAAGPVARMFVCFCGPFFNLMFAVLLLSLFWGVGFEIQTPENRIVLASEVTPGEFYPADDAGFKTGDRIVEIAGKKISHFHEVQENISIYPEKPLPVKVERDGAVLTLNVIPSLDKKSGIGIIGVSPWIDPVIDEVITGSPAELAGLSTGDTIVSVNGQPLRNTTDLMRAIEQKPETLVFEYERNGIQGQAVLSAGDLETGPGFSWALVNYHAPKLSFPAAVAKGTKESFKTLALSVKSLRLLFKGIDLTQAVSGPVRITYMMGDRATKSFEYGLGIGLREITNFIAVISIALCMMNLLPLPIIDGGMILLFFVELVRRKPAHPKFISIFQTCGMVIIFGLLVFAVFGDIMYFVRR